jgi:hypothetical protein
MYEEFEGVQRRRARPSRRRRARVPEDAPKVEGVMTKFVSTPNDKKERRDSSISSLGFG